MPREGTSPHSSLRLLTVEAVDQAIQAWFDKTVDVHVEAPNSPRRKVPVVFASGERWATGRTRRGIRGEDGKLILPIISVRRTGISTDITQTALGTEVPRIEFSRRIANKTNDESNLEFVRPPSLGAASAPVFEVASVPFPRRSVVSYDVEIQAQYMLQMNAIIEKILARFDLAKSFVATIDNSGRVPPTGEQFEDREPLNEAYVVGYIDDGANSKDNFDEFTDVERIVRYSTSVRVPCALQSDSEGERPPVLVRRTPGVISFTSETVSSDPKEFIKIFGSES